MDITDHLEHAFAVTSSIVHGITPEMLDRPTPCDEWNVARLVAHTIGALDSFAAREPDPTAAATLNHDIAEQFDISAAAALAAWRSPGAPDGMHARPGRPALPWAVFARINLVDTYGHAWDIAQATGQADKIDNALAAICLDIAHQVVIDDARPIVGFGPAREVPPDAPTGNRFAAFLGRRVPA